MPRTANPAAPGSTREVTLVTRKEEVTDRAHRYRANQVFEQLPSRIRNVCHFCGRSSLERRMLVAHVDGREEHNEPENIGATCRPCNNEIAANFARAGVGRRTRQFNPPAQPARNLRDYSDAVATLRGDEDAARVERAIAKLQATAHGARARFARQMRQPS